MKKKNIIQNTYLNNIEKNIQNSIRLQKNKCIPILLFEYFPSLPNGRYQRYFLCINLYERGMINYTSKCVQFVNLRVCKSISRVRSYYLVG